MSNNHTKMLALYNDLDFLLRERYKDNNMSNSVMMRFIKDLAHSGFKEYVEASKKLNMIRIIRNDLIHELDMNRYSLIEISDETISFLEAVIDLIRHPVLAIDWATKIDKLLKVESNDVNTPALDLIHKMRQQGHTQVPVLNDRKACIGVFTPNVVFDYINHHSTIDIPNLKVSDLKDFYKIDNHYSESYKFISSKEFKELGLEYIEINLSVAQCLQTDLIDVVSSLLKQYKVDPKQINLEIF